jgi:predicted metal-binding membrane protein
MTLIATSDDSSLESALQRDRLFVVAGLVVITIVSWGYLFFDAWRMSQLGACCQALLHPSLDHWPIGDLARMAIMWSVMMAAMMVPSAAPMVLTFAALNRQRKSQDRPFVPTGMFLLGYLLVWTGFSVIVTLIQWLLHGLALLSPMMVSTSPIFGAAILIFAGVFQFTRMKSACLFHCRTPLDFLMTSWREGYSGALKMGLHHGLSCTGCCWLLMVLLFVAGVMNLVWVATITIFVLVEKVLPGAKWISRAGGIICILWGVIILL